MQDLLYDDFVLELINSIQAGVLVYRPDLTIAQSNSRASWLLGLGENHDLLTSGKGKELEFFYRDGSRIPRDELPVSRVLRQSNPLKNLFLGIRTVSSRNIVWVLLSAQPIFGRDGSISYVVVTLFEAPEYRYDVFDARNGFMEDLTGNMEPREALRASRNYYQAIFENTGTGLLIIEEDTTIVMVNRMFELYTGYSKEEIENKMSWTYFIHPDDVEFMLEQHRLRRRDSESAYRGYEFRLVNRYGQSINIYLNIDMIPGTSRSLASLIDISGLKEAERELNKSRHELAQILEGTPVATFVIDRDHYVTHWNNACERLTGIPAREIEGSKDAWRGFYSRPRPVMADLVVDEALEQEIATYYGNRYANSIIFEETYVVEDFFPDLGEQGTWLYFTASSLRDEQGDITGAVETLLDVTERKKVEEELRESEGRLRAIFDSIPDIVLLKDKEGRYTHCNIAMEKLFGLSQDKIIGRTENELFLDTDARETQEADERVRKNGEIIRDTYKRTIGGEEIIFDTIKAPVKDNQGVVVGICAISRDITEQMRLRQEKKRIEEQYQQSQKIQAIGRLAGGVAHDLNNLLTPMLNYSEMLLKESDFEDRRKKQVEHIHRASLRARDLVSQLLAFGRKQALEIKILNINKIIRNLDNLLRKTIREDIAIHLKLSTLISNVEADEGQIEQVLINLAVNAQDAMPEGGDIIFETAETYLDNDYVQKYHEVSPGYYVRLTVSDTGQGMDEDTRSKIFDPFFTTKGKSKGTGLGLATVYGIVKQHEGHITVYSEPGQGTTFNIYLPVSQDEEQDTEPLSHAREYSKGSESVMVVEDNEMVRELTETILVEQGYCVYSAKSGGECLEKLQEIQEGLDLLLTDVVMPDMNGKELYEQVSGYFPGIKVLYMSGYTEEAIVNQGVLDRGVHYVQKPFTIATMTNKIREVLDS
ncbi:MAG: PAS domain-containing hybrid sensor histidine kinase/response regulator [Thermodesulfobacteriota bacterium]